MFGEREARLRQAGIAETFAFGALGPKKEQQLTKEVGDFKNKIKTKDDADLLKIINRGSLIERLTARELLKERGQLSIDEIKNTYTMYRKSGARGAASKFITSMELDKLNSIDRKEINRFVDEIDTNKSDTEARRKLARVMAEKGDFRNDKDGLLKAVNLFITESDKMDLINKARKFNIQLVAEAEAALGLVRKYNPNTQQLEKIDDYDKAVAESISGSISRAKIDDILEFTFTKDLLGNPKVSDALKKKFSNSEFLKNFISRASGTQIDALREGKIIEENKQPPTGPTTSGKIQSGETVTSGGIILTPGAQFDIDKEKRQEKEIQSLHEQNMGNVVDLRNKK